MAQIPQECIIKVDIKWNSDLFKSVPLDVVAPLPKFRAQLQELTGVPAHKQKIIFKGTTLKDEQDLSKLNLKDGQQIMLMGAREENAIKISQTKHQFEEDLTPAERAKLLKETQGIVLPIGLKNLGNTCYMNSSVQILKRVNELRDYVMKQSNFQGNNTGLQLFLALKNTFHQLEVQGQPFSPDLLLKSFFERFPQFAERDNRGGFKQQDADEFFQNLLQTIEPNMLYKDLEGNQKNLIQDLFQIEAKSTWSNTEVEGDTAETPERFKKLMCIIDNQANPVSSLVEGIRVSLEDKIQKNSEKTQNQHVFLKTTRIAKLPSYLLVQMVRFYWKQGVDGKEGVKAKILKNVAFPKILDMFDFCTPELQQQLQMGRDYEKKQLLEQQAMEQDELEQFKKDMEARGEMVPDDTREIHKRFKAKKEKEELEKHDTKLYKQHGFGLETGNYQLIGVLTHQGREADSGHYMAWVHSSGENWLCYNDDVVTEVKTEKILDLRGGGDWHMGYYLLYRKLEVE